MTLRSWLPPLLWAGVIVFSTSLPATMVPGQLSPFDKALHFTMYAVLGALLTRSVLDRGLRGALVVVIVAVAAFGAVDEWHQRFIPGRVTELADWVADSLGGAVGSIVAFAWSRRLRTGPAR